MQCHIPSFCETSTQRTTYTSDKRHTWVTGGGATLMTSPGFPGLAVQSWMKPQNFLTWDVALFGRDKDGEGHIIVHTHVSSTHRRYNVLVALTASINAKLPLSCTEIKQTYLLRLRLSGNILAIDTKQSICSLPGSSETRDLSFVIYVTWPVVIGIWKYSKQTNWNNI